MKKIFIYALHFYKKAISPVIDMVFGKGNTCRFELTCSEYAIKAVSKYGVLKGGYMAVKRIAHCHPLASNTLKYESI